MRNGKREAMTRYKYRWVHLATGIADTREVEFLSRKDFLEQLNHWNQLGMGLWQYAEAYT